MSRNADGLSGKLLAATLILGLSGCTTATGPAPAALGGDAPAGQPKVNRLVMGLPPPVSEVQDAANGPQAWPLRPMYENLLGFEATTGKLAPQLATEWAYDATAMTMTYALRKGVQFHGGFGEFTAGDVEGSWSAYVNRPVTAAVGEGVTYFKEVTSRVEVVDPYKVVFHLTRPDAFFLRAHSEDDNTIMMFSKAHFQKAGYPQSLKDQPLTGTGPYQYQSREQAVNVRFERPPFKHWSGAGPDFPEFEYRWMKEASTRLAALLAGEVQVTSLPQDLTQSALQKGMKAINGRVKGFRSGMRYLCCFLKDPKDLENTKGLVDDPLNDVRVRRALDKAIDRDALNKAFLGGKGELQVVPHFEPNRQGWNPDWVKRFADEYGYDPAKARSLLAEAGYGPGKPLRMTLFATPTGGVAGGEADMVEAINTYWRAAGIDVDFSQTDGAQITTLSRSGTLTGAAQLRGTSASQFSAIQLFDSYGFGGGFRGYLFDRDLNKAFAPLVTTVESEKQEGLYRQIGEILFTHHNEIPLFWLPTEAIVNPAFVADYVFPGALTGTWTHVQNIKAAR